MRTREEIEEEYSNRMDNEFTVKRLIIELLLDIRYLLTNDK